MYDNIPDTVFYFLFMSTVGVQVIVTCFCILVDGDSGVTKLQYDWHWLKQGAGCKGPPFFNFHTEMWTSLQGSP